MERFFKYVLSSELQDDCILVKVNLEFYNWSEHNIAEWLDNTLLEECEKVLYDGVPSADELQGPANPCIRFVKINDN
jgi:hypothetical protein